MAMKRCPDCGEKYSDTYKYCPFCEEEDALRDGEEIRRGGGRRVAGGGRRPNLLTPTLVVLIIIMASLLVYLLWGDQISAKLHGEKEPDDPPPVQDVVPEEPDKPNEGPGEPEDPEDPDGSMPEGQDPTPPSTTTPTEKTAYEKAMKLPDGLSLNKTDYTANSGEPPVQLKVSGGSGTYTWISEDEGIVSVDSTGKVTTVSSGTVNVVVTDGSKKAVCIVRSKGPSAVTTPTTPTNPTTPSTPKPDTSTGSGLKKGAAVVINGGNGVRVRSGPSTEYEALATVPNGASITIVEHADGDWYKITFSDVGGRDSTGYMKGEFLANQ